MRLGSLKWDVPLLRGARGVSILLFTLEYNLINYKHTPEAALLSPLKGYVPILDR